MIQTVDKFQIVDTIAEIATVPLRSSSAVLFCKENGLWYRRANNAWTADNTLLQPIYDNIQDLPPGGEGGPTAWGEITGTLSAQTDLQTAFDGKAASSHNHATNEVTGLDTALSGKQATLVSGTNIKTVNGNTLLGSGNVVIGGAAAWGSVTGTLSDQTDLQTALDGKTATGHAHATSDITGLDTALSGKASSSHAHAIGEVTGLQTALDGKSATSHNHTGTYEPANANIQSHISNTSNPHGVTAAQVGLGNVVNVDSQDATNLTKGTIATARLGSGTANSSTFLRGDNTWASPSGGSDPWTHVVLGSNFTHNATSNASVTGLFFTPAANKRYLVEVNLLLRTATATAGARPGFSWPSGMNDWGGWIQVPNSATASAQIWWGTNSTANAASTGLVNTTSSWMAIGGAMVITGASPSGNFQVTLASESTVVVTMRAGSVLRYREY